MADSQAIKLSVPAFAETNMMKGWAKHNREGSLEKSGLPLSFMLVLAWFPELAYGSFNSIHIDFVSDILNVSVWDCFIHFVGKWAFR